MARRLAIVCWGAAILLTGPLARAESPTGTWVTGTARDATGRPVAGVPVYVAASFDGGMRMCSTAAMATTGPDGTYAVAGQVGLINFSATIVVGGGGGLVPTMGWFDLPSQSVLGQVRADPQRSPAPPPVRDFTVGSAGGQLDVLATEDDRPAVDATVAIRRAGGDLRQAWAMPTLTGPAITAEADAEAIATPRAVTGVDGVAHFERLPAGVYDVIGDSVAPDRRTSDDRPPWGRADGVPVRTGVTVVQHVRLYAHPDGVRIRPLDVHGKAKPDQYSQADIGLVGRAGWMTSVRNDPDGACTCTFAGIGDQDGNGRPGLFSVELKWSLDGSTHSSSADGETAYDAAIGWVAVSSLLVGGHPVDFNTRTIIPATIGVTLTGIDGQPIPGPVTIERQGERYDDTEPTLGVPGRAVFTGVPPGRCAVKVWPDADPAFVSGAVPADAALSGQSLIPEAIVTVGPDDHRTLSLHAVPVGYLRGVLKPPPGTPLNAFAVYPLLPSVGPGRVVMDDVTGRFVAGPFPAGLAVLQVVPRDPARSRQVLSEISGDVIGSRVIGVPDVTPPLPPRDPEASGPRIVFGWRDVAEAGVISPEARGRVFLADGRTAAAFARVIYVPANAESECGEGSTDAGGFLHSRGSWWTPPATGAGGRNPVVVAFLPGMTGGTIVDVSEAAAGPASIILPLPRSAKGRVTIGGETPAGVRAEIRVLASRVGHDRRVDTILSVTATPQSDGRFELAGLTPGDYLVQAAVDNIWLSASVPMHVAADRDPSELSLDVPTPEGPVAVTVVDAAGRPVVGRRVTVDRPAGPLTAACWPDHFTTDGAGVAYVPALEAGPHTVHVGRQTVVVNPPALPCEGPAVARYVVPADGE